MPAAVARSISAFALPDLRQGARGGSGWARAARRRCGCRPAPVGSARMRLPTTSVLVLSLVATTAVTGFASPHQPSWELSPTGVTARLRGLSAVSDRVAWASGSGGTVLRTVDGGRSWQPVGPPGAGRSAVPRHRGVRRAARGDAVHRRGRGVPDLPHGRRRPDLDRDVPQRPIRSPSTTAWPSSTPARAGALRPGRRASSASWPPRTAAGPGGSCRPPACRPR